MPDLEYAAPLAKQAAPRLNRAFIATLMLANFGTSYHFDEVGPFEQLKLQFNVYNIASTKYWATVGTNGFVYSDPMSVGNNTLQTGTPRTISGTFTVKF